MDETESNEQGVHAGEAGSLRRARRIKIVIAAGVAVVALAAIGALWATRNDGGSADDAAAGSGPSISSSAPAGASSTSTSAKRRTGPTTTGAGSSGLQTTPRDTSGGTNTTVRGAVSPTTRPVTPGSTGPPETVPPSITAAYTDGFDTECRHIWQTADADGLMWDADWIDSGGVAVTVCYNTIDKRYAGLYETVDTARQGGKADADESMVDWAFNGVLTNTSQTRTWTGA